MPVLDGEAFIAVALQSLTEQTLTAWRCIVVDDGSTDSTAHIVAEFAAADHRIRLLRQSHAGVSHARNLGLAALEDEIEYVALLDSDDCYLPDALEVLVGALDARPDAVGVYGLAEYVDHAGVPIEPGRHSRLQTERRAVAGSRLVDVESGGDCDFAQMAVIGPIWPSAVTLLRRSVVSTEQGFDASFTRQGDWELYLRMTRHGPFAPIGRQVAWYRRHAANLTGDTVESCYQQDRVRYKAWTSASNTAEQRRVVLVAAKRLLLADIRRKFGHLRNEAIHARIRRTAVDFVGLAWMVLALIKPGLRRPSRRRVVWTRYEQILLTQDQISLIRPGRSGSGR